MENLIPLVIAIVGIGFVKLTLGGALRDMRNLVQFNIQGSNPMVRLVPNISYTLLFFLLLSLTMGDFLVSTTINLAQ